MEAEQTLGVGDDACFWVQNGKVLLAGSVKEVTEEGYIVKVGRIDYGVLKTSIAWDHNKIASRCRTKVEGTADED